MPQTVLIADDSPTIQNKAKGILTGEGLEVVTVSNGVAAIKKLPQLNPVLVLADVSMPGRDGYEVCNFVKSSPELRHIPVILIFSDTDPYNEEQGARVHADGRIRKMAAGKPFDPAELISAVTGFLAHADASTPASGEAASAPPSAERAVVTEPGYDEPALRRKKSLDFGTVPQGFAFADPVVDEIPSSDHGPPATYPMAEAETAVGTTPLGPPEMETSPPQDEEVSSGQDPVLIEEEPAPDLPPPASRVERTMMFRAPSEIAEPFLNDELAPAAPSFESSPAAEDSGTDAAPSTTLGSFPSTDTSSGERRSAFPPFALNRESAPSAEAPRVSGESIEAAGHGVSVDADLVNSIVQKVVAKMSPPALSPEVLEEVIRKIAGEIIADLIAESP